MSHFSLDIFLSFICLLLATRCALFWENRGHDHHIHVDFFPVYTNTTGATAADHYLMTRIPQICTVSLLKKALKFKDHHGSGKLTHLYIFVVLVAMPGTPKQILVLTPWMAIHISRVGSVMSVLDGKTEVFVAIHVTSGTT